MNTSYDYWLEGDCGVDDRAEARAEAIDAIAADYRADDAKLREAEDWIAGTFDGAHYTALTLALYRLHNTPPDRLAQTDILADLYRLARVEADAMDAALLDMAERDYDDANGRAAA